MSRYAFQGTFRDGQGNIVSSGQIIVYPAGTTTVATIYADDTTVDVSPYVESDSNGYFIFYVDDGDYDATQLFDIQLSKTGYASKTYPDIAVIRAPSDAVSLATVKADSDIADAISKKHSVGDSIASSISDGDTTHSPDGNSVFDALALKLDASSVLDEDDMASDSALLPPSQKSVKAYVDEKQVSQIKSISASVGSNALTLNTDAMKLDFRSATLTNGAITRSVSVPALSLVVPSGATLGMTNGVQAVLALVVLYNAGNPALGVVTLFSRNLDETTLLSTTAIDADADSASVVYSASAITDSPFRVVGYIVITEAVAGTWATAPRLVQGCGGQAMAAMQSIGNGQTWQSLGGSRALGTTYYNTTSRPILVNVGISVTEGNGVRLYVNGVAVASCSGNAAVEIYQTLTGIVPPGGSYIAALFVGTTAIISLWAELR
jgi:hypothetical protein